VGCPVGLVLGLFVVRCPVGSLVLGCAVLGRSVGRLVLGCAEVGRVVVGRLVGCEVGIGGVTVHWKVRLPNGSWACMAA
jgi:hypothetical protein